jgi:preprotein translocase subunit SecA
VPIDFDLSVYEGPLAAINAREAELLALTDLELRARSRTLRDEALQGTPVDQAFQVQAYALVREASRRTLGLRPFDEQVMAALALDGRRIVEMQTGEGKTLAAVMPAYLNALTGRGVHILTFNDYLARRDAEWMGPVFSFLELRVGWIEAGLLPAERRRAYLADVTYVTAKEAGFDHLRDQLVRDPADLVHRPFHFALVDEADSILIDEARIPLVIAGRAQSRASSAERLAEVVARLERSRHFTTDEYGRNVEPTEAGFQAIEAALGCGSLHAAENYDLLTELHCALHARVLLRRDVDYIVREGRVDLVDELTGRVVEDRHWPDGLQAALEAKEGLERRADGHVLGSITLQHFLGSYERLSGMTGTAQAGAREIEEFYGARVVVIPPHRPLIRIDQPDLVFTHRGAKEAALVEEIRSAHATRRPVLVGTASVEESERLHARLVAEDIPSQVLNARNDTLEASVVAGAGALGAVTISTNMAGRGTDIRLGGADERERDAVVARGGLYVIGTNRHECRRIDLQLRGRAGRQGDPGESRFFISLEDDLLVRYGIRDLLPERFLPLKQDAPIDHLAVRREIERAQRIVEGQDFEIRRTLSRYSGPIEEQRLHVQAHRQAVLAAVAGEDALGRAEALVTLHHLDRAWRDHLAFVNDLRDGIHLVRLGGGDPLSRFKVQASEACRLMEDELERSVQETLARAPMVDGKPDLTALGIDVKGPSSTWTYLVNDDPFRDQLGSQLIGPGKASLSIGAAVFAGPLFLLLLVTDRWFRKRPRRG